MVDDEDAWDALNEAEGIQVDKKGKGKEKEREEAAVRKAAEEDAARVAAAEKAAERKRKRAEPEDVTPG